MPRGGWLSDYDYIHRPIKLQSPHSDYVTRCTVKGSNHCGEFDSEQRVMLNTCVGMIYFQGLKSKVFKKFKTGLHLSNLYTYTGANKYMACLLLIVYSWGKVTGFSHANLRSSSVDIPILILQSHISFWKKRMRALWMCSLFRARSNCMNLAKIIIVLSIDIESSTFICNERRRLLLSVCHHMFMIFLQIIMFLDCLLY